MLWQQLRTTENTSNPRLTTEEAMLVVASKQLIDLRLLAGRIRK
jgi:hypothetical protein